MPSSAAGGSPAPTCNIDPLPPSSGAARPNQPSFERRLSGATSPVGATPRCHTAMLSKCDRSGFG